MSGPLRLILFDVDGTLVDSQGDIVASMTAAFDAVGHPVPARAAASCSASNSASTAPAPT